MNASQRRIEARKTLRAYPVGSVVTLDTGKPATVVGVAPGSEGRMILAKRRDNRKVAAKPYTLQG